MLRLEYWVLAFIPLKKKHNKMRMQVTIFQPNNEKNHHNHVISKWVSISIHSSYGLGSSGSAGAGSSAIDRYYSFLDDISSPTGGINRTSSSYLKSTSNSTDHYSMPNRYTSRYSSSDHSGSSSGASSSSSGYSSSIRSSYGSSTDYQPMSSRYSR